MILKFKSIIQNQSEKNVIEFKAQVKYEKTEHLTSFEFQDPQSKNMNLIEIHKDKIDIFTGALSLNLKLNEKIQSEYTLETGQSFFLQSLLHSIDDSEENVYKAHYQLFDITDNEIGTYNLELSLE